MAFKLAVLSIDGGGIKGIVPAMILAEIERRTEKSICELFDLIAGTSTGGILALGLTKPNKDKTGSEFKATDLVDLYKNNGGIIFKRRIQKSLDQLKSSVLVFTLNALGVKNLNPEDLFSTKYTRRGKADIINEYFGSTYIKEALTEVLITSYATNIRMPLFFTSNRKKEQEYKKSENFCVICEGYKMVQAALATSAAPTYFKPYVITSLNRRPVYTLIDGGVFANNPTSIAIIEAMNSYKMKTGEDIDLQEILVVSIGTGRKTRKLDIEDIESWGQLRWIDPLINMVMNGQSEVVDYQMEQLLSSKFQTKTQDEQYYRFQVQYPEIDIRVDDPSITLSDVIIVNDAMDDASEFNISALVKAASQFIEIEDDKLKSLCEQLKCIEKST